MRKYLLRVLAIGLGCLLLAGIARAQTDIDIKAADLTVTAMVMGEGDHAVIALPGRNESRRFFFADDSGNIGSALAKAGFRVLAIEWPRAPGAGKAEIDAAIRHARESGAKQISLLGFSMSTMPISGYAAVAPDGELNTVVLLSAVANTAIPSAKTKKLFAFNKGDRLAKWDAPVMAEKSSEPKVVLALDGNGHFMKYLLEQRPGLINDVIALLKL
jgi:hypothetical protein